MKYHSRERDSRESIVNRTEKRMKGISQIRACEEKLSRMRGARRYSYRYRFSTVDDGERDGTG